MLNTSDLENLPIIKNGRQGRNWTNRPLRGGQAKLDPIHVFSSCRPVQSISPLAQDRSAIVLCWCRTAEHWIFSRCLFGGATFFMSRLIFVCQTQCLLRSHEPTMLLTFGRRRSTAISGTSMTPFSTEIAVRIATRGGSYLTAYIFIIDAFQLAQILPMQCMKKILPFPSLRGLASRGTVTAGISALRMEPLICLRKRTTPGGPNRDPS